MNSLYQIKSIIRLSRNNNTNNLIFFTFFISFFKVIFDLISFMLVGLIAAYALGHESVLDNTYLNWLENITKFSKLNLLILFFLLIFCLKFFFDFFKSYLVNKVGFNLWVQILRSLFTSISVSNYSKEELFKTESIILTESLNVVWNYFFPLVLILSELLFLVLLLIITIFILKYYSIYLLFIILFGYIYVKLVKNKISSNSEKVLQNRKIFGRNINSLLSSMPDFILSFYNWKHSGLEKNIKNLSSAYRILFTNRENFSYLIENIYLIILFSLSFLITLINVNNDYFAYFTVMLVLFLRVIPSLNRVLGQIGTLSFGIQSLNEINTKIIKIQNLTQVTYLIDNSNTVLIEIDNKKYLFDKIKLKKRYFFKKGLNQIVGSNGSGKSTLLQGIYGVNLGNKIKLTRDKNIGYLSQNPVCLNNNVKDELQFAKLLSNSDINIKEINDLLKNILNNTKIKMNERIDNLSGGQRQIVAICRIIIQDPNVILLDEPFSSMDFKNLQIFKKIIYKWKLMNKNIIVIDHTNSLKVDSKIRI